MTGRLVDLPERIGHWQQAFDAVRREITPDELRTILAAMKEVDGVSELASYMSLARNVMANDRTAATVAAMLVTSGIRPLPVEVE
jgi:hypothetical protein